MGVGARVPGLRAGNPVPAVSFVLGLGVVVVAIVALALIPGWYEPERNWRTAALGPLNRPFLVIAWLALAAAAATLVVSLMKAHGRLASVYVVERADGIVLTSWLGALGLGGKRLLFSQKVIVSLAEEPSTNPNGLIHFRLTVASGGRSFRIRSFAPPTPESISRMREHLRSHDMALTFTVQE